MMKRVSFSLAETYEADVIKKYQYLKKCSFSAAIKECLKLGKVRISGEILLG
ncbi:TPA: hypothetical protein N7N74_004882 [Escherichia coli]|nr:hypothetical protein [Escherichia coli]